MSLRVLTACWETERVYHLTNGLLCLEQAGLLILGTYSWVVWEKKNTFWPFKMGRLVQYSLVWGAPVLLAQRPDAMSVKSVQSFPVSDWLLFTNPRGNWAGRVSRKFVFMSGHPCTWVSFCLTFLYILWLATFPKSMFLSLAYLWGYYGNH